MTRYRGYGPPPLGITPRRSPRPEGTTKRGRAGSLWCKNCLTNVIAASVEDWDNTNMVKTMTYKCSYCGRIIARESKPVEEF